MPPVAIWKYNWQPEPGSAESVLYDDYLVLLDSRLTVDRSQVERLLRMTASDTHLSVPELESHWLTPGAMTQRPLAAESE